MTDSKMKQMNPWAKYSNLGAQLLGGLLILLYVGKKLDLYFNLRPMFIWILPFLFILSTLIKIIKDTKPGNDA
jgi:F0F1-type ATP synthase assembly protein I